MSLTIGVSMFLREAKVDCGGSFSEGALHVAIGGIQDHVAITCPTGNHLPETC